MRHGLLDNLVGREFSRLTVVERTECPLTHAAETYKKEVWWKCDCSCGTKGVIKPAKSLRSGNTRSCGCLNGGISPEISNSIMKMIISKSSAKTIAKTFRIGRARVYALRREMAL